MSKKRRKKKKVDDQVELNRQIRKDWNGINPVTRVIPDKRRKKPKHKGKIYDDE